MPYNRSRSLLTPVLLAAGFLVHAPLRDEVRAAPGSWSQTGLTLQIDETGGTLALDNRAFHGTQNEVLNLRLIDVGGSTIRLIVWEELAADAPSGVEAAPFYAISLDGTGVATVRDTSYVLKVRHGDFEPHHGVPSVESSLGADDAVNLYVVQFYTQPLEVFRSQIRALGGTVHQFLANHAHIVKMTPEVRDMVVDLPYVRWVGPLHPAYRLEEFILDNREFADLLFPLQRYNIQVFEAGVEEKSIVADRIKGLGGTVDRVDAGKYLLEATLTPEQLFAVVRWDEVLFVDRWSPYELDMDIAREFGGANHIETVAGYTGQGVRAEVYDAGFNMTHVDFASRPLIEHGAVGSHYHGASTSGICFGDGTGDWTARGLLPEGQGIVSDYSTIDMEGPNRYIHTGELLEAPYFGVFQTASVGSGRTTQYTTISADTDAALFDFDVVHLQSQSNAGDQDSRPQAWAKNIISVGGVHHYDTSSTADDCWCSGGSIGPASDGRIKPDLCAYYDYIRTVTTGSPSAYTSDFGGTSGATPIVAGHVGLFFQMWSEGIFGNEVDPGGTVFENRSHMTTCKAVMINTAQQYPFIGTGHDLTRTHQGWGWPDVGYLYDMRDNIAVFDETEVLENLDSVEWVAFVVPQEPAMRVTMTYADPPGVPLSSQHRINDLTLKVTSPTGTVYWGNNGLLSGNWSTPGGTADTIDTVENVFIQNPAPGAWLVEVTAAEINQDGHVETPELDADFALVVSGAQVANCTSAGRITLNRSKYACADQAMIRVVDCDLNTSDTTIETVTITLESDTETDGESIVLTETAENTADFRANVELSIVDAPGVLQVTEGDTITATYIDTDDGEGGIDVEVTDVAVVDCTPPVISNVETSDIGPFDATVTFDTDEPSLGAVRYGLSCAALTETATQSGHGTEHSLHLTGLSDDSVVFFAVEAQDEAGNPATDDNGGECYSFSTPDIPIYFTEQFSGDNDLAYLSLMFTPDGSSDFYSGEAEEIVDLPTDPSGGATISLSDDDSEPITLGGGETVSLYDESYTTFYVGSNGYITFTSGDDDYGESLGDHFNLPRISCLFDDMNPSTGGTVSWEQLSDRAVVTWLNVPEWSTSNSNTFQVEMYFDGRIRLAYTALAASDGLAGLSAGGGIPSEFYETDLSEMQGLSIAGDYDGDGDVDLDDYAYFFTCMDGPDVSAAGGCEAFFFDEDNDVDLEDFRSMQLLLGTT